jgi:hypothetical protein
MMNKVEEILLKHWKLQDIMAGKIPTGDDCRAMIRDAFEESAKTAEFHIDDSKLRDRVVNAIRTIGGINV